MQRQSGILINLSPEDSAQLIQWVHEVDWRIITSQINKKGKAMVFYKTPDDSFPNLHHLAEIPEKRGVYRPYYGDVGGGFEYVFRATTTGGIKISGYSQGAKFYKIEAPPLEITISQKIETDIPERFQVGYGILAPSDNYFKAGENQFGFYGEFFSAFHQWRWYSEDIELFEFSFVPMSIGCLVRVLHIDSNETLDLTQNVNW